MFSLRYGDKSMEALSDLLRGTIVAGPGKVLIAADYNAIEARVLMWLADEQNALTAYRRGDSPYVDLARTIFNNPAITKKTHPKEYDLGKRAFLGYGYGMATVASIPVPAARPVHRQTANAVKKHRTAVAHHQAKPLSLQDVAAR